MSKEVSIAPKERINIKYVPSTGNAQSEIELPLRLMVIGDFKGEKQESALEDRQAISIDKNNFSSVMSDSDLSITTSIANCLVEEEACELPIHLSFKSMADFSPDAIVSQVPELKKIMELREALTALKGPLGNIPAFRAHLQNILSDPTLRDSLLSELKISYDENSTEK